MLNLKLETENGTAYVDAHEIDYVSGPFQKGSHKPARTVGLRSGRSIFILNTAANRSALLASGIGADIPADDAPKPKGKRGRPPGVKRQLADSLKAQKREETQP